MRDKLSTCKNKAPVVGYDESFSVPTVFCGSMPKVIAMCGLIIATNYHFFVQMPVTFDTKKISKGTH